jgi:putative nucleotidyltransferase with HDIG domain
MGKSEPTLFERLETESEKSAQEELSEQEGLRHSFAGRIAIAVLTVLACAGLLPAGSDVQQPLEVGSEWQHETLVAEYPFPIYKPQQQYSAEVLQAREQVHPVFTDNGAGSKAASMLASVAQTFTSHDSTLTPMLSAETLAALSTLPPAKRDQKLRSVCTALERFHARVYGNGFVNVPRSTLKTQEIVVRVSPAAEQVYLASQVVDSVAYMAFLERFLQENFDELGRRITTDLRAKLYQPNLLYSAELSAHAAQLAEQSIPRTIGVVRKGEVIVARGERLTEATIQKLRSSEYTRFLYSQGSYSIVSIVGNVVYAGLVYSLLLVFIFVLRKRIYYDNGQLLGVSMTLVGVAGLAHFSAQISTLPLKVIIPVTSMLVAIIFDSRTTFTVTVAMAVLSLGFLSNDFTTAIGALLAGTFAAYTVRDLRNRTQLFKSIAFIFLGYAAPIIALALRTSANMQDVATQLFFAAISGVASPILTLGLLFMIERMLNITTDLRLLEYDNLNHPLLTELNEKAPGTYQHTLKVAQLAEAAAIAVGANPILVKVGAYFHDIGKMRKAEYFVENQINVANKHNRISPTKSASIIRQHVEEGLELATNYKLPQRIVDFIPMHHGTMLIKFFYVKALEDFAEKQERGEKATLVDEEDFRYPGPRPNSKETGILMLADAVEAVSHTIDTNDRDELETVIDKIVEDRLIDKQLDECDLTMPELTLIKESFVKNLLGTGHQRVKYKDVPREDTQREVETQDTNATNNGESSAEPILSPTTTTT